jgi:5'-3' exonuclease
MLIEADDVLGTLSKQAAAQGMDTVIVTGDPSRNAILGIIG